MPSETHQVGVRELRQNLSVYLDRVKRGESLTVTEHNQSVAVLAPVPNAAEPLAALVAAGRARPAGRPPADLPRPLRTRLARPLSRLVRDLGEDAV